jgi:hypothetical protein
MSLSQHRTVCVHKFVYLRFHQLCALGQVLNHFRLDLADPLVQDVFLGDPSVRDIEQVLVISLRPSLILQLVRNLERLELLLVPCIRSSSVRTRQLVPLGHFLRNLFM